MDGCRPKFLSVGLGCGIDCMLALSVLHSSAAATVCGLWGCVSAVSLSLPLLPFVRIFITIANKDLF